MMPTKEMLNDMLLPGLAFLALAAALLPIPRWQSLLLWALSTILRLAGFVLVGLAAVYYFGLAPIPAELADLLESSEPARLLGATILVVLGLVALTAFLDFTRRLWRASRQVESLVDDQQTAAALIRELLARSEGPGASLTAQRRSELLAALPDDDGHSNSSRPLAAQLRERTVTRRTLGQLLR